jgi:hypothetical protein
MRTNVFFAVHEYTFLWCNSTKFFGFAILCGWKRRTNVFINIILCTVKMLKERAHVLYNKKRMRKGCTLIYSLLVNCRC